MDSKSYALMEEFAKEYIAGQGLSICDVGSYDVNGTYKPLFNSHRYLGLDIRPGPNVDIVSKDQYNYPFPANYFDVVISGQTIEHVPDIFQWIKEITRIVKTGGLVCIISPMYFRRHASSKTIDCWRVYPDGLKFLFSIANLKLLKIVVGKEYGECMGIACK